MLVDVVDSALARSVVEQNHYLHRKPIVRFAYGLYDNAELVGVVTFGNPSDSTRKSVVGGDHNKYLVIELNRLWVDDKCPRNTESWFVSRALKQLPPFIVISFADLGHNHEGYIYRALNFKYAGRTDDGRGQLYDYVFPDGKKHSRNIRWGEEGSIKIPRSVKNKYWTTTGNRTERHTLSSIVQGKNWQPKSWKEK